MTIKECIDIVDNAKPNQYSPRDKVMWLSFIDEIIINDVLKTHEGYDGKYDDFEGYTEDKLSVPLIVPSPYDRLYTAYLKMKIDEENGETARYNNSAALFNSYMMEYRKFYNKTHIPLDVTKPQPIQRPKQSNNISDAVYENLKRELYYLLSEDFAEMTSQDKIYDIVTSYVNNNIEMLSNPVAKKAVSSMKTTNGTVVSQNADFAEVAEWADGNPNNEDRTGYFVSANVPVDGIVMKKATSTDDVKGVSILTPAFAGNYTKDKLDSNGNLLPKYSYVAIIGFVPVIDNGTCTVGGRCMPDDNGCAIPSSNNMGYQVVNRVDENRVLIIIEPNGDMVQRIKSKINGMQDKVDTLSRDVVDLNQDISHLAQTKLDSMKVDAVKMPSSPDIERVPSTFLVKSYVDSVATGGVDLTDYVKKTDYGSDNNVGVLKSNYRKGITATASNGELAIYKATDAMIDEKTNVYCPIVPSSLDYAVKSGLTDNKLTFTDEEKTKARALLGAIKKPDRDTSGSYQRVPATNNNGEESSLRIYSAPLAYALAQYGNGGILSTNTPTAEKHCANKAYVDSAVGDIETALDNIIAIQNSLIGGDA